MLLPSNALADLRARFERSERDSTKFRIAREDLERWCHGSGLPKLQMLDGIGALLAIGFHEGRLSFGFCDAVANELTPRLYEEFLADGASWPELFWEVFLAFDSGEFYPNNDRRQDPVEAYTRPLIAAVVAKLPPSDMSSN